MGNFRNEIRENFTQVPNDLLDDVSISDRARFLFCWMASRPIGWNFYVSATSKAMGYTAETLRKYINELIDNGWLVRGPQQSVRGGKFGPHRYTLKATKVNYKKPYTAKSVSEISGGGKKGVLNNKNYKQQELLSNKNSLSLSLSTQTSSQKEIKREKEREREVLRFFIFEKRLMGATAETQKFCDYYIDGISLWSLTKLGAKLRLWQVKDPSTAEGSEMFWSFYSALFDTFSLRGGDISLLGHLIDVVTDETLKIHYISCLQPLAELLGDLSRSQKGMMENCLAGYKIMNKKLRRG